MGALLLGFACVAAWALVGDRTKDPGEIPGIEEGRPRRDARNASSPDDSVASLPPSLVAAERYVADPNAARLRSLVEAVGGMESVVVGEAEGAFDLVRFDPLDPDRLIASVRSSYGDAQNQGVNEIWQIDGDGLAQEPLAAQTPHDFAHFNIDGSITMWIHDEGGESFAPRTAKVLDRNSDVTTTTRPMFASRFTAVDETVFASTGDGDYYSNRDTHEQLIASGSTLRVLDSGEKYEWIDIPVPGLLVAYPRDAAETTAVWSTATFERIPHDPLAGRPYQRVAVSGDQRTAVGVTFDGKMEQINLTNGRILNTFGSLDPRGIDQPLTLNHDGGLAVSVDRSGQVALRWVGDDIPVATVDADTAQPRWVSAKYGALAASTVAASAERVALRSAGGPLTPVTWTIVDIGIEGWISTACALGGRALTAPERTRLGVDDAPAACV